jgi:protein gp37
MSANSKIEWTHHTFNPWWGCTKVSAECDNCYAERDAIRYGFSESGSKFPIWGRDTARRGFGEKHWQEPRKWNRKAADIGERHRVFCASYADVMEELSTERQLVHLDQP